MKSRVSTSARYSGGLRTYLFFGLLQCVGLAVLSGSAAAAALRYEMGPKGLLIESVDSNCPLIYDNDWWADTPDKNYLWAKASLGQANLRGNIVTRDMWDWRKGYLYTLQQGLEDARKSIAIVRRSGLTSIPDPVAGCDKAFSRPKSGKIEDTTIVRNEGSDLIVAEAGKATPTKPLLIFVGGPLNTVANAYLTDPSIADSMVVFMTDLQGYNGKDRWANYIVATRCKLVNYGAHVWWPQRPGPPVMPLDRFEVLPNNEMTTDVRRIAKEFWERSTRRNKPDRDDGFADGAPIFLVFKPETWQGVQRQKVNGIFGVKDTAGTSFDLLDARKLDYGLMTEEFFSVLKDSSVYGPNGLAIAFGLPRVTSMNAYISRWLVVEAVYQATLSSGPMYGRIVNTGTLVVAPTGVRYQPDPADRLIVKLGEQTHEFVVKEAQGNIAAPTAMAWLLSPHVLNYTHRLPGQAEAEVSVRFDGYRFEVKVQGWSMLRGRRYTADLAASGQSSSVRDFDGQEVRTECALTGKIQGSGVDLDVNERHVFNMAAASSLRLLPSQRGSASRFSGTLSNVLRVGDDEYKFDGVEITTDMKARGGKGSAGVTSAAGQVLRSGEPFGRCVLRSGQVILETEGGPVNLDLPPSGS